MQYTFSTCIKNFFPNYICSDYSCPSTPKKTKREFGSVALDSAVYSCPCAKHSDHKYNPTLFNDCPCDLSIVNA